VCCVCKRLLIVIPSDYIVWDLVRALRATFYYYSAILPNTTERFSVEMTNSLVVGNASLQPLPPIEPPIQYNIPGCTPDDMNVTDIRTGLIYAVRWAGVPFCDAAKWVRTIINDTKANRSVYGTIEESIGCDIDRLQSCSVRHDFWESVGMFGLVYAMIGVGISFYTPFLMAPFTGGSILFALFAIWWMYGISPNCLPMVPVCLWDDAYAAFDYVTPYPRFNWTDCLKTGEDAYGNSIFIDCQNAPYSFDSGIDSLAFFFVRWAPTFAERMIDGSGWPRTLAHMLDMRAALLRYWELVKVQDNPLTVCRAQSCFWLTSLFIIPVLTGGGIAGFLTTRALALIIALLVAAAAFLSSFAIALKIGVCVRAVRAVQSH